MIITTLNLEKKEELEDLELSYKNKIAFYEENQRILENSLNEAKENIKKLQRQLDFEIQKKEELEDELMQKGSGHDEEVSTRIKFESKVNQMYAKERDMDAKIYIMKENVEELKQNLEIKSKLLAKEKKNYEDMLIYKEKAENECRRIDEKLKLSELTNESLDQRLNEAYNKIDELNQGISKAIAQYSECQNEVAQKKIEIEDKKFEIELRMASILKAEKAAEELKLEKNIFLKRTIELERLYNEECDKNQHYKQEYARVRESDSFYAMEYTKSKDKLSQVNELYEELKEEKNKLKIQLESMIQGYEEYKIQVKKGQERIEEMNKGRRIVEEHNEYLNSRLSEKNEELKDARSTNLDMKNDIEKLKTRESSLESEVTTLTIKLRSLEKQYEANKETMQQKINSLTEILGSEKRIRENWIFKFEEEQKNFSLSNRLLVSTQDQQSELKYKLNKITMLHDEKIQKLKAETTKNSEQLEEILELKAYQEELQRKNKTLQLLYENSEGERLQLIQAHMQEMDIQDMINSEAKESLKMGKEELQMIAALNLEKFYKKCDDYDQLHEKYTKLIDLQSQTALKLEESIRRWNRKCMCIEDIEIFLRKKLQELQDLEDSHMILNEQHEQLTKEYRHILSLLPEELKETEDPFAILIEKYSKLSETLQEIEYLKENMNDFEGQYDELIIKFDENTQTDIGSTFFEKPRRISTSTPLSGSQRLYSAKNKDAPSTISEFLNKKKNNFQGPESIGKEETPTNLYHQ